MVSLKLLAEQVLLACPNQPAGRTEIGLFISRELPLQPLVFRSPTVLYVSPNNPGAIAVAEALRAGMNDAIQLTDNPSSVTRAGVATHMLLYLNDETFRGESGGLLADELRQVRCGGRGLSTRRSLRHEEATVLITMVHENDPHRGGCEFDLFFQTVSSAARRMHVPSPHGQPLRPRATLGRRRKT